MKHEHSRVTLKEEESSEDSPIPSPPPFNNSQQENRPKQQAGSHLKTSSVNLIVDEVQSDDDQHLSESIYQEDSFCSQNCPNIVGRNISMSAQHLSESIYQEDPFSSQNCANMVGHNMTVDSVTHPPKSDVLTKQYYEQSSHSIQPHSNASDQLRCKTISKGTCLDITNPYSSLNFIRKYREKLSKLMNTMEQSEWSRGEVRKVNVFLVRQKLFLHEQEAKLRQLKERDALTEVWRSTEEERVLEYAENYQYQKYNANYVPRSNRLTKHKTAKKKSNSYKYKRSKEHKAGQSSWRNNW
jgi:hypothetical protein